MDAAAEAAHRAYARTCAAHYLRLGVDRAVKYVAPRASAAGGAAAAAAAAREEVEAAGLGCDVGEIVLTIWNPVPVRPSAGAAGAAGTAAPPQPNQE